MGHGTATAEATRAFGEVLRYWRGVRGKSQLDLASTAMTTPRYISFVETGRSQPSRQMVVRLARALDIPLRERNGLLARGRIRTALRRETLDAPQLARVEAALASMLDQHEPFPAVVMDRQWNVLHANAGAQRLFGGSVRAGTASRARQRLAADDRTWPGAGAVRNWDAVVPALLERAQREAVGGVLDGETAALVERLRARPDVAARLVAGDMTLPPVPVIDVWFTFGGTPLNFFSVVSTIGTPIDVTAQELRLEAFFPSDDATPRYLRGSTWSKPV